MDPAERKLALRSEMREVRRRIAADHDDRAARSARIWSRLVATVTADGTRVDRVLLFDSLPGEPDTGPWMEWCAAQGIDVFVPQVDGPDLRVMPGDRDPGDLDLVVVPGLAFTPAGGRLGQGGGHFDRFLPRLREDCIVVGVGFAEQLVDDVPLEPHDVVLDHVVTDAG